MAEEKKKLNQVQVDLRDDAGDIVKTVTMHKLTNKMVDQALDIAISKVKDGNQMQLMRVGETELMKVLLVSIDGKNLSAAEKEQYKDFFEGRELEALGQVVEQMRGKPLTPEIKFI